MNDLSWIFFANHDLYLRSSCFAIFIYEAYDIANIR